MRGFRVATFSARVDGLLHTLRGPFRRATLHMNWEPIRQKCAAAILALERTSRGVTCVRIHRSENVHMRNIEEEDARRKAKWKSGRGWKASLQSSSTSNDLHHGVGVERLHGRLVHCVKLGGSHVSLVKPDVFALPSAPAPAPTPPRTDIPPDRLGSLRQRAPQSWIREGTSAFQGSAQLSTTERTYTETPPTSLSAQVGLLGLTSSKHSERHSDPLLPRRRRP